MIKRQETSNESSSIHTGDGHSSTEDTASSAWPTSSINLIPSSRYRDGRNPCVTPRVIELGDGSDRTYSIGQGN